MELGVKIGHDQQSVTDVGNLIRYIIDAPTGERVKMAALETMKETLTITNTSFSDCFIGDNTHNHYGEQVDAGEEADD
jgi:hypothetical protein